MADFVYWTTRIALVAAWLTCAVRAWRRRSTCQRVWRTCAVAAAVFASLRAWPWNYQVLEGARDVLRSLGVYDNRLVLKFMMAGALLAAIVISLRRWRQLSRAPGLRLCCTGLALQATLIAIWTFSLDDVIPQWLAQQPGRYLLEASFATVALIGTWQHAHTTQLRE